MGAPYTPKQEDAIIDQMMAEDQPLVPRVDKFHGQERWGVDTPLQVGDLSLSDAVHMGLQTAGWAEGWGSLADAADAFLYGLEGEYGEATLSGMAAIPGLGGYVAAQRYLKAAEDAGETIYKVYRGVGEWHQGTMVKEGKFVGGPAKWEKLSEDMLYTSLDYDNALSYATRKVGEVGRAGKWDLVPSSKVLEFHVPQSFLIDNAVSSVGKTGMKAIREYDVAAFKDGLPKGFLKKVHGDLTFKSKYIATDIHRGY